MQRQRRYGGFAKICGNVRRWKYPDQDETTTWERKQGPCMEYVDLISSLMQYATITRFNSRIMRLVALGKRGFFFSTFFIFCLLKDMQSTLETILRDWYHFLFSTKIEKDLEEQLVQTVLDREIPVDRLRPDDSGESPISTQEWETHSQFSREITKIHVHLQVGPRDISSAWGS